MYLDRVIPGTTGGPSAAGSAVAARDVRRVLDQHSEVRDTLLPEATRMVVAEEALAAEGLTVVAVAGRAAAVVVGRMGEVVEADIVEEAEVVGDALVVSPLA